MSLLKFTLLTLVAYCLSLFFALAQTGPAPEPVSGRVQTADGQPLAYVSVGIPGTPVGTVSNEQGLFTLTLKPGNNPTDSVRFSLLGYHTLSLPLSALRGQRTLVLTEKAEQLAEVRVLATTNKTIGNRRIQTNMKTNLMIEGQPSQNLGSEVGRRFNLPNKTHLITQYRAYILSNFTSVTMRINLYEARTMRPLLTRNVYVTLPAKHNGWVDVDLEPYRIVAKGDVVASVQWVGSEGKGTYLALPILMPAMATHHYRYGSQNRWKTFRGMSTAMTLEFSRINDANTAPESNTVARQ
ncbi:carboxypeptidase-like regulatory domain-containing protein [Rudanella paleaurantiibacter]|uniref:Carboxypeptidase-like regulatory domain-containing protein n=1 Tax=Rudanella paleaurantiibacter TaxID=2614655 RepID=A0A7J5U4X1_9BACT|nr:carboxypeptidase-like regulatory domain-containing protein [Rudanella paleaurantiibacter]KAB7732815.1 carboxypeptidase-like regulatory domain-containing protein [Rudanella paleaurantiibacter]